ncbi:putative Endophilin-B1 [Hypsibius exemplaris]|uniref:Endophilin-B1 n=1 Tax=Hypsibius exemplaris TaxID=2072580 RepID=A0A1W0WHY6_HYPEX|nr:putative Endophilin-B1 [Hypsibius exemplaris]
MTTTRKKNPVNCLTSVFTDCYRNINRNVQRTEECFGHPGGTTVDEDIQRMCGDTRTIIKRHKRVISMVEQYLKHGPLVVTREFIYEAAERKANVRTNEQYHLGTQLVFAGRAFGDMSLMGEILIDIGHAQQDLGHEELKFVTMTALSLLVPMRTYLNTFLHAVVKQQHLLDNRRLDLDAAVRRFHHDKAAGTDSKIQRQARMDIAQVDFDTQQQRTRTACVNAESEKKRMVIAFLRFVECQLIYMRRCTEITESLKAGLLTKLKAVDNIEIEWPLTELDLGAKHIGGITLSVDQVAPEPTGETGGDFSDSFRDHDFTTDGADDKVLPADYERSHPERLATATDNTASFAGSDSRKLVTDSKTKINPSPSKQSAQDEQSESSKGNLARLNPLSMLKKTWDEMKAVVHLTKEEPLMQSKQQIPVEKPVPAVHEERESVARDRRNAHGPLGHQSIMAEQFAQYAKPEDPKTKDEKPATLTAHTKDAGSTYAVNADESEPKPDERPIE